MKIKAFNKLSDDARVIRTQVFINEQGFENEFDSTDDIAIHFVMYNNSKAIATCRAYQTEHDGTYAIGRVAVVKEYRGRHLGELIMKYAEDYIRSLGGKTITISAQVRAGLFYVRLGYKPQGEEYFDEHCPHICMTKCLQ